MTKDAENRADSKKICATEEPEAEIIDLEDKRPSVETAPLTKEMIVSGTKISTFKFLV